MINFNHNSSETIASNCFNGKDTPCSDLDEHFLLNAALPGVVNFILDSENGNITALAPVILRALNELITSDAFHDELFATVSVKDFLFDGYTPGE